MKTPVLCLVIAGAGAVGLCGGWVLWGGKENAAEGVVSRAIASGRPGENGPRKADRKAPLTAGPVGSHAAEVMARELDIINALTPQEFGIAMTDLWLAAPTPDNLVRRGLYLASCNGERGEQFYVEYKRRKGLGHGDQSGLGEFFTGTGRQDGRDFLDRMLKRAPGGFYELESVTHGWAQSDARGAVDWLNALPESAPYYDQALRGLMWGLAQNSPEQAMQVYTTLDPAVRTAGVIANIGRSTVENHGIKGLAELLSSIPDEKERESFFNHSLGYAHRESAGDFVQYMSGSLTESPWMQGTFNEKAARWAALDPDHALAWLSQTAEKTDNEAVMAKLAFNLAAQPGKAEALRTWAAAHPDAPGRQVIEDALAGGVTAAAP